MDAIFGFAGPHDSTLLDRMSRVLAHRGDQERGMPLAAGGFGWRGHSRLRTVSNGDALSGLHAENGLAIALAGRLYESPDCSQGDLLPTLLRRWRREGTAMLASLRGAFALAILDPDGLHLVRDGVGARPIFHGMHEGRRFFAVEQKAILAVPGFPRRLRAQAVAQYLSFSFVPGPETMLEDVFEVLPGHVVTLPACGGERSERWFRFEDAEPEPEAVAPSNGRSSEDWIDLTRRTVRDAVAERLPDDEPVGVFLSGGLDSSIVAAEAARQSRRPIRTWSIHFGKGYPNELAYARAVAEHWQTEHEEVLIEGQALARSLHEMIRHLDVPIGDPITAPNFHLARHASAHVNRVFNGEGGDPLFGGPKNYPMLLEHWYGGIDRGPRFREQAYLASYRRAYDDLGTLLAPNLLRRIDRETHLEGLLTPYFETRKPRLFLNKLAAINIRLKAAHLILPKVDRMYGAFGIAPLMPLFDEKLLRLSFAMPPTLKLHGGIEKRILKLAYADALPAAVIERPKSGMRVPVQYWFQGELKKIASSILGRREVERAGIFVPDQVEKLLAYETDEGQNRHGIKLWMLLTFEMWRRMVIEGDGV